MHFCLKLGQKACLKFKLRNLSLSLFFVQTGCRDLKVSLKRQQTHFAKGKGFGLWSSLTVIFNSHKSALKKYSESSVLIIILYFSFQKCEIGYRRQKNHVSRLFQKENCSTGGACRDTWKVGQRVGHLFNLFWSLDQYRITQVRRHFTILCNLPLFDS